MKRKTVYVHSCYIIKFAKVRCRLQSSWIVTPSRVHLLRAVVQVYRRAYTSGGLA